MNVLGRSKMIVHMSDRDWERTRFLLWADRGPTNENHVITTLIGQRHISQRSQEPRTPTLSTCLHTRSSSGSKKHFHLTLFIICSKEVDSGSCFQRCSRGFSLLISTAINHRKLPILKQIKICRHYLFFQSPPPLHFHFFFHLINFSPMVQNSLSMCLIFFGHETYNRVESKSSCTKQL